jgi:hypothetical protein
VNEWSGSKEDYNEITKLLIGAGADLSI